MADRPLLTFPNPGEFERHRLGSGPGPDLHRPRTSDHQQRVEAKLTRLEETLQKRRIELRDSPAGIEPEKVLVLETADRVDFATAVRNSEGLEWLLDWDEEFEPEPEGFRYEESEKDLRGRVFLVFSNQQGLEQLKSLWERYKAYKQNPEVVDFPYGKTQWRDVFENLRDIRPWGPKDRLKETGLAEEWRLRREAGEERIKIEIELWYREDPSRRKAGAAEVQRLLSKSGGEVITESTIPEISYHAVLGELRITEVDSLLDAEGHSLVRCDEVMLFRPSGQATVGVPSADEIGRIAEPPLVEAEGEPWAAFLDGIPQQNHSLLRGRLVFDDPEGWEAASEARERRHGTAMASLAIWGNLENPVDPPARPIYIRPILQADPRSWEDPPRERVPEYILPVQLVFDAVRRLYEPLGDDEVGGVAPSVRVIGLAVCDSYRPFSHTVSAWARLLDYLAYKHNVLFVVSAGNQNGELELSVPKDEEKELFEDDERLTRHTVQALLRSVRHRRVLSPSESLNSLTVGAAHRDRTDGASPAGYIDPLPNCGELISPISSVGFGHRRALKPDLLFDGGRQVYRSAVRDDESSVVLKPAISTTRPPGIRAAYPSNESTSDVGYLCGTSPATAQTVGIAARLMEQLDKLEVGPRGRNIEPRFFPVLVKALLVHSSDWGEGESIIRAAHPSYDWREQRRSCERLLGYGTLSPKKAFSCTDQRATLLGWGSLSPESAHRYQLPLPDALSGARVPRRVKYTLAWLSSINANHQKYRRLHLYLSRYGDEVGDDEEFPIEEYLAVKREQVGYYSARRGTVQHNVFSGDAAPPLSEQDFVELQVNCREDAGRADQSAAYGLVASLEVPETYDVPVYTQIRTAIRARVGIEAG